MTKTDHQLLEGLRRGRGSALAALYDRYERRLFGFILSYVANQQDAEEVLQDTFLALLASAATPASIEAWIFTVARNRSLNRLRARRTAAAAQAAVAGRAEHSPNAEDALALARRDEALAAAVTRLPPQLGEIYRLRTSGHSYEEMAARLAVPLGTVKSRLHSLVQRLRKDVEQWLAR